MRNDPVAFDVVEDPLVDFAQPAAAAVRRNPMLSTGV